MRFHIVRSNETLYDIMSLYNLTKEEIIKENKHITSWRNLVPGTKLKIPAIPESVEQGIKDMEPFIEDYYPKLKSFTVNKEEPKETHLEPKDPNTIVEEKEKAINIMDIPELKDLNNDDYPDKAYPYYPYYGYYPNYQLQQYARYPVYYPSYIPQEIEED